MALPAFDEGSFRDPEGHVFSYENEIYRTLSSGAYARMNTLLNLPFFNKWVEEGKIIPTKLLKATDTFPKKVSVGDHVLWHEKIEYLTYPFEWSFSMLKDAGLLMLDLLEELLENNFILKDGTAWNISFYKGKPCFYDILSIDVYQEGQPWEGFSQFLQEFLYPLMLQAHHNVDFQSFWRATHQGIPVSILSKTMSKTSLFKRGVFKYVFLQEKLSSSKTVSEATIRHEFSPQVFPKKALLNFIKNLRGCVESLQINKGKSIWKDYYSQNSYEVDDTKEKESFIREGLKKLGPKSVMDLGCNTGHYSLIAAKASQVIACDLDPTCIDQVYSHKNKSIVPVVLNLMTPSPSMGWSLNERKDVFTRLKTDSFMALALIHHLCISQNVPLNSFVQFLKFIAPQGIVEWVDKTDPMVKFLLRNRADIFKDYTLDNFKDLLSQHFNIEKMISLNKGTRNLLLLSKKE